MLLGIAGVGGITGSLLSGRISRGARSRPVILTSVALLAAAQLGLAVANVFAVAAAALFVASMAYGLWGVVSLTLRQRLAPDALLARAGAGHRLLALGFSALGALLGGFVARAFGLRATYAVGALLLALVRRIPTADRSMRAGEWNRRIRGGELYGKILGLIGAGRIGSAVDQALLYCYQYDPATGKYSLVIMNVLRLAGLATVMLLGTFIVLMCRWDRRRTASAGPSG